MKTRKYRDYILIRGMMKVDKSMACYARAIAFTIDKLKEYMLLLILLFIKLKKSFKKRMPRNLLFLTV
jgi:hypothetical protein